MTLAVHKIVARVLRCGDIDSRFREPDVMHAGSAAHRKLQREAPEGYAKEVTLKLSTQIEGLDVVIQGRADGIITQDDGITIDEIKSTALPLDILYKAHPMHLGQAKCYAHMYVMTLDTPPARVGVRLTYYRLDSGETQYHIWYFTPGELALFFTDLLARYGVWLRRENEWKHIRDASIREATFPFPAFRPGQRAFAAAVYRHIADGKKLYATAPTGVGKTISAIVPAVKAMGEGKCDTLFYLTAKTIARTAAQDAAALLCERGLRFKALTLRAKDKICPQGVRNCTPEACANANGHYDRVNDALLAMLSDNDRLTVPVTLAYARQYRVCPHELALDAALYSDMVIGDYNHVFDPVSYLRRFFDDPGERKYVFLIDEAHNLAERVRDMYSCEIRKSAFSRVCRVLRGRNAPVSFLRKALRGLVAYLADLRAESGQPRVRPGQDTACTALVTTAHTAAGEWLSANKDTTPDCFADVLDMYFSLGAFLLTAALYDERFTTLIEPGQGDIALTLLCLDPSALITQGLARGVASVLFSATLTPLPYYRDILGGTPDDTVLALPSPFDPGRLRITINKTSTKYADRAAGYAPVTDAIYAAVTARKGNYLAFFPSYAYLNEIWLRFDAKYPAVNTLVQQINMTEDDREDFLAQFDAANAETLVGFTVLGGIFSEGIDLKGDRLIGAVIVSAGIPMLSLRSETLRDYYNKKNGQGYDYAYTFPGMNKVLQAAGRVIRTEEDEGTLLLIDSRFATARYRALFPPYWRL